MNGSLLQSVVLTSFGNAYLAGTDRRRILNAIESHIAFEHVQSIQFGRSLPRVPYDAVKRWFKSLDRRLASRLWLTSHCRVISNIGGRFQLWDPSWTTPKRSRAWAVNYLCETLACEAAPDFACPKKALAELRAAVNDISDFADSIGQDCWSDWFKQRFEEPPQEDRSWYLPEFGYTDTAVALLLRAAALILDGHCPWNDCPPINGCQQKNRYYTVTNRLDSAATRGVRSAVNSFAIQNHGI